MLLRPRGNPAVPTDFCNVLANSRVDRLLDRSGRRVSVSSRAFWGGEADLEFVGAAVRVGADHGPRPGRVIGVRWFPPPE